MSSAVSKPQDEKEQAMLNINPETVCHIIEKAREFQAKEQVVIPDVPDSPADDWPLQVLAEHVGDLTYQEVVLAVTDLEPDQQMTLVALMWVGRGDYAFDEWGDAVAYAEEHWTKHTAEYLIGHPQLADYLREGLDELGYRC